MWLTPSTTSRPFHVAMPIFGAVCVLFFCLVAWTVARLGGEELLRPLATYMLTVVLGLTIHALIVLPF